MGKRIEWMDLLRGNAILLMLLWHATSVPSTWFDQSVPRWLFLVNEAVTPLRMPVLMFLSGMLLAYSMRKPFGVFLEGKLKRLLWPFLIFVTLHNLTMVPMENWGNPLQWMQAAHLWYIFNLLIYYLAAPIATRIPWWIGMPILIAVTAYSLTTDQVVIRRFLYYAVFFYAGHFLRPHMERILQARTPWIIAGVVVSVGYTALSLYLSRDGGQFFRSDVRVLVPVFVMMMTAIYLGARIQRRWPAARPVTALNWLGRNSIYFYLSHLALLIAFYKLCDLAGIGVRAWQIPFAFLWALVAGYVLTRLSKTPPVRWLFEPPELGRGNRAGTAKAPVSPSPTS